MAATQTKQTVRKAMTASEFIAWAKDEAERRRERGRLVAQEHYCLVPIAGGNMNSPEGYLLMKYDGTLIRLENGRAMDAATGKPYGDQERLDQINAQLAHLGSAVRVRPKHFAARTALFTDLPVTASTY